MSVGPFHELRIDQDVGVDPARVEDHVDLVFVLWDDADSSLLGLVVLDELEELVEDFVAFFACLWSVFHFMSSKVFDFPSPLCQEEGRDKIS